MTFTSYKISYKRYVIFTQLGSSPIYAYSITSVNPLSRDFPERNNGKEIFMIEGVNYRFLEHLGFGSRIINGINLTNSLSAHLNYRLPQKVFSMEDIQKELEEFTKRYKLKLLIVQKKEVNKASLEDRAD